ncbi:11855_t:CDS:2, partial [Acaulospora colombiana]
MAALIHFLVQTMPLPLVLDHKSIVTAIDADDFACAFLKDARKPGSDTLPDSFVTARLVNGDRDLQILYAPDHKLYQSNGDNTMRTTIWGEIKSFGSSFSAAGARAPEHLVTDRRVHTVRNSIGLALIKSDNPDLMAQMKDQLFGLSLLQNVLDANVDLLKPKVDPPPKMAIVRTCLWNEKGIGGKPDYCIIQLPPLYAIDPSVPLLPTSSGPSPRKRGGGASIQSSTPTPVLPPFPTTAATPGTLYPPSLIPGYDATIFSEQCRRAVRAIQPSVFDTEGNPILPCHLEDVLIPGTIVQLSVSFHGWYSDKQKGA